MAPSADPLLACEGLHFAYVDRFTALDGVSLEVGRGESLALLGANGCGKSTLLKVLDGLIFPDRGRYLAFGEEVTEDKLEDERFAMAFRSRVGFIFQNSEAQVFSPSVRDEIAFGLLQLGLEGDEVHERISDVLGMLEIEALADRAPYQLSGGEKKRVAIASVLVMSPEVLLFDEPTAGLDPRTHRWLLELIVELRRAGKTIVLATHDLDVVRAVAGRCVVMSEDHRIVAGGSPADVLADHAVLLGANLVHEQAGGDEHVHPLPPAEAVLRDRGRRVTRQRRLIWDALTARPDVHLSADDLVACVTEELPRLNPSTVYRTLDVLVDEGLVVRTDLGGDRAYYEPAQAHRHHHLVCERCGSVDHVHDDALHGLVGTIAARYEFQLGGEEQTFKGLCARCRRGT
ncbi:MAG TPA: ATP-binding cassette domain-containing protein [Solirubrobacteraceae bacterium]